MNRLISIDNRIGTFKFKSSPYYSLMTRYYIKEKYVQVLFDVSSFTNVKVLMSSFNLVRMIYRDLNKEDYFGLKILKNGYNTAFSTIKIDQQKKGGLVLDDKEILTQPTNRYLEDVLCFE